MGKTFEVLRTAKVIAVVGLSHRRFRPSYGVSEYMQRAGYRIIPVNPLETEVLGERAYPTLLDIPHPVDIVNVFRRAEFVPEIAEQAICIRAKCLWLQEGILHEEAARRAAEAGLIVIVDKCILKEHRKMLLRDESLSAGYHRSWARAFPV